MKFFPALIPKQDGRIFIELINWPFLDDLKDPAKYKAGLDLAIASGWPWKHESAALMRGSHKPAWLRGYYRTCAICNVWKCSARYSLRSKSRMKTFRRPS